MFWRSRDPEEELAKREEEVKRLEQRLRELEQKKKELEAKVIKHKMLVAGLADKVKVSRTVYALIPVGKNIVTVKGKLTADGLTFKFQGNRYTIIPDPNHIVYIKKGRNYRPAVYVDIEAGSSIPPPKVNPPSGEAVASKAVSALLTIYRNVVMGTRQQTMALVVGLIIAAIGMTMGLVIAWISMNSVNAALGNVAEALRQVSQVLQQVPAPPVNATVPTPTP